MHYLDIVKNNKKYNSELPTYKVDPSFSGLTQYLEIPLWEYEPPATPQDKLNCVIEVVFFAGLHWLIKEKWGGKRFSIKAPKEVKSAAKPIGDFLLLILNLCQECTLFAGATGTTLPTNNAWAWFVVIFWEIKTASFKHPETNLRKSKIVKNIRHNIISPLKQKQNPVSQHEQPNLKRLFDCCIELSKISPQFHKKHWKPFLDKYTSMNSAMQNNSNMVCLNVDPDKIFYRKGQGKAIYNLEKYFPL